MADDGTDRGPRGRVAKVEWPQALSLFLGLIAVAISLASQAQAIPPWLTVVLVGGVMAIVAVLVCLAVVPVLVWAYRQAAARRRRAEAVGHKVLPALTKAMELLESRLLMGQYIYSWPAMGQLRVNGTRLPDTCSGMQLVLERWLVAYRSWARDAEKHQRSAAWVKLAVNGLVWIGMTFEDMIKKANVGQAIEKQAWAQFCADYHQFIALIEDVAATAASVAEGIVQHRFDRLPA